jgi:hypothetical protein
MHAEAVPYETRLRGGSTNRGPPGGGAVGRREGGMNAVNGGGPAV